MTPCQLLSAVTVSVGCVFSVTPLIASLTQQSTSKSPIITGIDSLSMGHAYRSHHTTSPTEQLKTSVYSGVGIAGRLVTSLMFTAKSETPYLKSVSSGE